MIQERVLRARKDADGVQGDQAYGQEKVPDETTRGKMRTNNKKKSNKGKRRRSNREHSR